MLLENGAWIEAADENGDNPLMLAAGRGYHEVVRMLLENGAWIEVHNRARERPLNTAMRLGHVEVVRILLEKGANKHCVIPKYKEKSFVPIHHRTTILRLLSDE